MVVIGLTGRPRAGKDTVADYLVLHYGFVRFSFADALREEAAQAFGLPDTSIFTDGATKDEPSGLLRLDRCNDLDFVMKMVDGVGVSPVDHNIPRHVLQWYGTQYRRAQNEDYWLDAAIGRINSLLACYPYPELEPQYFVFTDARFPNEQEFIHEFQSGNLWHVHSDRPGLPPVNGHASNTPLLVLPGERQIWNNSSIDHLHRAVDLLLSTNTPTVRCEPMKPMTEPEPAMLPHGPYCCEKGEEQRKTVCDECNETSRLYREQS